MMFLDGKGFLIQNASCLEAVLDLSISLLDTCASMRRNGSYCSFQFSMRIIKVQCTIYRKIRNFVLVLPVVQICNKKSLWLGHLSILIYFPRSRSALPVDAVHSVRTRSDQGRQMTTTRYWKEVNTILLFSRRS